MNRRLRVSLPVAVISVLPFLLAGCFLFPKGTVADPVHAFLSGTRASDPCRTRIERVILDFNNDGTEDMAVSKTATDTDSARRWNIYLRERAGRYRFAGAIIGRPTNICVEPLDRGVTRVTSLYRKRRKMIIEEYRIKKDDVRLLNRRRVGTGKAAITAPDGAVGNIFRGDVEFCALDDYLRSNNCLWKKKRS